MKYIITQGSKIIAETHDEDLAYRYLDFKQSNIHDSLREMYNIHHVKEDSDIIEDINTIRI